MAGEKLALVQRAFEPGQSILLVASQADVFTSLPFQWRKAYVEGSLVAVGFIVYCGKATFYCIVIALAPATMESTDGGLRARLFRPGSHEISGDSQRN